MSCVSLSLLSCCAVLASAGCGRSTPAPVSSPPPETAHADHGHPSHGPLGGALIELGNEEYHAELVHDAAADEVSIYILDAAAKSAAPIEATEIVINLKHHGAPEQHPLVAVPQEGDPAGRSSRFVAKDNPELNEDLEHDDADARLQVTINGTPYSGNIAPTHGHKRGGASDHKH